MMNIPDRNIFSVSQLNRQAKQLLETHLPLIWVSGEISNLAKPSSGHWYFSLKDDKAQVRCAMFRNANQRLRWSPQSGDQVIIRARVSLYEGRGEYQLIAEHMEQAGAGLLQQQYEQLKAKLEAEGLFDPNIKKNLPAFPKHIGVITSPTGAAIGDILSVLRRRYPVAKVTLLPTSVQGDQAVPEMLQALKKAEKSQLFDTLIIGRGGGSIEDLWAFNNESLARAIAACPIPIVSAVGHEMDFTIADFVADQRAPTPSVSAEIVVPEITEWMQVLDGYQSQLIQFISYHLNQSQQQLTYLKKRLRHPSEQVRQESKQLQLIQQTLAMAMAQTLSNCREQLRENQLYLQQQHPSGHLKEKQRYINELQTKLLRETENIIDKKRQMLTNKADVLDAISPLKVISRGYSITSQKNGSIVKSSKEISVGDEISTRLAQGTIKSVITECSD